MALVIKRRFEVDGLFVLIVLKN